MIYSHQISDPTKRKTVTHSFNDLFTCHREKPIFEGDLQTTVLKKPWNSHFLTTEFHSGCKNTILVARFGQIPFLYSKMVKYNQICLRNYYIFGYRSDGIGKSVYKEKNWNDLDLQEMWINNISRYFFPAKQV